MTTYDDIVTHATQGLTLKQTSKLLELSGRTIQRLCKANNTTWSELKPKLILKHPRSDLTLSSALVEGSQPSQSNSHTSHSNHSSTRQGVKPGTSPPITNKNGNIPTGSYTPLSPYIQEVMQIQSAFVVNQLSCSVKDAIELRAQAMQFEGNRDIPAWELPPMISSRKGKTLYDSRGKPIPNGKSKQEVIIDAICDPTIEIVAVESAKRHGKSTAAYVGICQGVWENRFNKIGLWASGEDNAIGILGDVFTDEISVMQTMPLFKGQGSAHQKIFFNNAILKAFSNNAARTSGLDFDLCWIDEAHEVVVEHKEVFDMIVMTMRAKPSIKLLITMNKGTGTYHNFKRTLENEFGKEVIFFTIEDQDIVHITQEADKKVRTLVRAVGGKGEESRWLDNKDTPFGTFDAISVMNAYDSYTTWLATHPQVFYTVFSYDPSGTDHAHGWDVWACDQNGTNFWQLDGGEFTLGETLDEFRSGEKLTPQQLRVFMIAKARKYLTVGNPKTMFIAESNMNGKEMKAELTTYGYFAKNQNFASEKSKKGVSRDKMCYLVRGVMDDNAMYFFSEILLNQLSIYNPNNHKGVDEYKGNEADSTIHAIYRLCKMSRSPYLYKAKHKQYQEIDKNVETY